jgi:4-hydroxy-2-oxoheptanedioate aldolase
MTGQELCIALRGGKHVFSTLVLANSPRWAGLVKSAGVDFVFIDTEHIPLDRLTLSWMCQTYQALGIPPIVRIPSPDPFEACKVLDGGASGVIAPYVETPEQVRDLVGATKYRPLKGERLAKALDDPESLEPRLREHLERRNANNVAIVNIESVPAMERLDEILTVPGLDAVLIGPNDLSINLGIPEQYRDPRFDAAVNIILGKARENNVGAGIHFIMDGMDLRAQWIQAGCNLIVHSVDARLFSKALREDLAEIRQMAGDDFERGEEDKVIV